MNIIPYTDGLTIEPGQIAIVSGMPNAVYHVHPHVSNSQLTQIARSPAHFKYGATTGTTSPMAFGTAVHMALLEPESFATHYICLKDVKDRRAAEYKAAVAAHGEDRVLLPKEADQIAMLCESVQAQPRLAAWLAEPGHRELSIFAVDDETGAPIRCRFDLLTWEGVAVDVKTTRDARHDAFSRSILQYRYHVQDAFYSHVFRMATGQELAGFKFAAIESDPPHAGKVYELDYTAKVEGQQEFMAALNLYAECEKTGVWPMYDEQEEIISLPDWKLRQIENDLEISTGE